VSRWTYGYHYWFRQQLLGDPTASKLIALGVTLPLLMAAFLYSQYEGLPSQVTLHLDAHGVPDSVGKPRDVWQLPLFAVSVLAINTALATMAIAVDRFLARLLVGITPVVQIVASVALWRIVN
jgi:hypothetical protein